MTPLEQTSPWIHLLPWISIHSLCTVGGVMLQLTVLARWKPILLHSQPPCDDSTSVACQVARCCWDARYFCILIGCPCLIKVFTRASVAVVGGDGYQHHHHSYTSWETNSCNPATLFTLWVQSRSGSVISDSSEPWPLDYHAKTPVCLLFSALLGKWEMISLPEELLGMMYDVNTIWRFIRYNNYCIINLHNN